MPTELHSYLCSYCGNMVEAPAGSVDRTREFRCANCALDDEETYVTTRLRWMTA